jgi:hypothetical protein
VFGLYRLNSLRLLILGLNLMFGLHWISVYSGFGLSIISVYSGFGLSNIDLLVI